MPGLELPPVFGYMSKSYRDSLTKILYALLVPMERYTFSTLLPFILFDKFQSFLVEFFTVCLPVIFC
jgi:hypothetical protein